MPMRRRSIRPTLSSASAPASPVSDGEGWARLPSPRSTPPPGQGPPPGSPRSTPPPPPPRAPGTCPPPPRGPWAVCPCVDCIQMMRTTRTASPTGAILTSPSLAPLPSGPRTNSDTRSPPSAKPRGPSVVRALFAAAPSSPPSRPGRSDPAAIVALEAAHRARLEAEAQAAVGHMAYARERALRGAEADMHLQELKLVSNTLRMAGREIQLQQSQALGLEAEARRLAALLLQTEAMGHRRLEDVRGQLQDTRHHHAALLTLHATLASLCPLH